VAIAVFRAGEAAFFRRPVRSGAVVALPGLGVRRTRPVPAREELAVPLLVSAVSLFYAGCAFAYFLVLPTVFGFLTKVTPEGVAMMTDIQAYLDFVLVIFLAFGASFELR
jgi:Sec-independent protein secretion pathway component TatC